MIIFWNVRCLSQDLRCTERHKKRYLVLDDLPSVVKYGLQYRVEVESFANSPAIRFYKHLFLDVSLHPVSSLEDFNFRTSTDGGYDYFEDRSEDQVPIQRIEKAKGKPVVTFSTYPFMDNFYLATGNDYEITCAEKELESLQIFHDLYWEMKKIKRPFCAIGVKGAQKGFYYVPKKSDEEIHALVMLFRKLYTEDGDPGSFPEVCKIFRARGNYPIAVLARDSFEQYELYKDFDVRNGKYPFPMPDDVPYYLEKMPDKLTIDDFIRLILYTQFHHSPKETRKVQLEALRKVIGADNSDEIILVIFLFAMEGFCHLFDVAGQCFDQWYQRLLHSGRHCKKDTVKLQTFGNHVFVDEIKKRRVFQKYMREFARELWEQAGMPTDGAGPYDYEAKATELLEREISLPTDPKKLKRIGPQEIIVVE